MQIEVYAIFAAIIGAYAAIIGVIYWCNSQTGKVWDKMNEHHQNGDIHRDAGDFVTVGVCQAQFQRLMDGQIALKEDMKEEFKALKEALKSQRS